MSVAVVVIVIIVVVVVVVVVNVVHVVSFQQLLKTCFFFISNDLQ